MVLSVCKTEKRNNQLEHGQPWSEQETGFSRAPRRMSSMFEAGKWAWQLSIKFV